MIDSAKTTLATAGMVAMNCMNMRRQPPPFWNVGRECRTASLTNVAVQGMDPECHVRKSECPRPR